MYEVLQGDIGTFDYDEGIFSIESKKGKDHLIFIGDLKTMQEPLKLPNGCIDTSFMFIDEKFPEGTNFDEFNMCGVVCADYMFAYCDLRNVDHFGDLFDTTSLKSAVGMFINVSFGEGFYFGSNFSLMHLENTKKILQIFVMV